MPYRTDLIKSPQRHADEVRHKNGNTADIIETVLYADKQSAYYTKEFAATLKGAKIIDTCRNIWQFVKTQIPYVLDKRGYQWVKSPGRLWAEKAGDCKSFSVFVGSCLQNLGIAYGFRFASYKPNDPTATHVYVYVPQPGGEIIIDAVWDGPFNTQKVYSHKKDIMSEVHYLGDVGFFNRRRRQRQQLARQLAELYKMQQQQQQPMLAPVPFPQGGAVPIPATVYTAPVVTQPVVTQPAPPATPLPPAPPAVPEPPRIVVTGVGRMSKKKRKNLALHLLFPSPSTQIFRKIFGKKKRRRQAAQLAPVPFPQGGANPIPATLYTQVPAPANYVPGVPIPELFANNTTTTVQPIPTPATTTAVTPHIVVTGVGKTTDYTELVLPKDPDKLLEGELDLLLTRQRLAIEKQNSARVGGPFNFQIDNYDKAIAVVNKALANLHNPDVISGMGQAMEDHSAAIGKKGAAGKFFKKIGAGLKKGLKAVAKVATAPQRLAVKGIMEIYLPKAAYLFLYLFADPKTTLPDVMKRKKAKAEKFKKFVVNAVGMKEAHFMGIIRNALTKKLGKSPESYLAEALRARVSGIGAIGKKQAYRKSSKNKAHPKNKAKSKGKKQQNKNPYAKMTQAQSDAWGNAYREGMSQSPGMNSKDTDDYSDDSGQGFQPQYKENPTPVKRRRGGSTEQGREDNKEGFNNVVQNLGGGNWIGAIISAVMWIIKKVVGLFKKKRGGEDDPGDFTKNDIPDIEADAANVFEYRDMQEDFSNLPDQYAERVKDVATDLMLKRANEREIDTTLDTETSFLTDRQRAEVKYEIYEGPEAIDENEAAALAREIKDSGRDLANAENNGGGSSGTGLCHC